MNVGTTASHILSLLLSLLRRRLERGTDRLVEVLFGHSGVTAIFDLLSLLRPRLIPEDNYGSVCELGDIGTTELVDCLLEGRAVHGAKSATGRDLVTSKRVQLAVRDDLLLAVGLGGDFAADILVGLGSLGLGFGLRFAVGGHVGSVVTGVSQLMYWLQPRTGIHTRRCSSMTPSAQGQSRCWRRSWQLPERHRLPGARARRHSCRTPQ
jgi:hypothetical protein